MPYLTILWIVWAKHIICYAFNNFEAFTTLGAPSLMLNKYLNSL